MLRPEVVELINSGEAWAFIGSGVSADAGYPTWDTLVHLALSSLPDDIKERVEADPGYVRVLGVHDFPRALGRAVTIVGSRDWLDSALKTEFQSPRMPGTLAAMLAEWPFAGYITTNFDHLIEQALAGLEEHGWVPIGNTDEECRKTSGNASRVVWHVHGDFEGLRGSPVVTDLDYDRIYLEDGPLISALRALLQQRRVVFFGFGFRDPQVLTLLKRVGRLCHPARPAYAFLSDCDENDRKELLRDYNVDVIPYSAPSGAHTQLVEILQLYRALVLNRRLRFGKPKRQCPSFHPESTSLLTYNRLVLETNATVEESGVSALIRARILAILQNRENGSLADLANDLSPRVSLLGVGSSPPGRIDHVERVLV